MVGPGSMAVRASTVRGAVSMAARASTGVNQASVAGGATIADGQDTSLQPSGEAGQAHGRPALQYQR